MSSRWPQHHLVAVAVAALIVGPRWPVALAPLAVLAWVTQPRPGWATATVVVALLAGAGGTWRVAHAWDVAERPMTHGAVVRPGDAVELLEAPTQTLDGSWRFDVRLRGARVEMRTPAAQAPPVAGVGRLLRVRGTLRPVSDGALGARSRGIALTLRGSVLGVAGRRGGWRGQLDRFRERAEATLAGRVAAASAVAAGTRPARVDAVSGGAADRAPPVVADHTSPTTVDRVPSAAARSRGDARAALLRGMVLGQDDGFTADEEDAYRRSGLSHLVAASGQNVALVAAMVLGIGALVGIGRPWRIGSAIVAVAAYVPLAGAGPSIRRAGAMGVLTLLALGLGRVADRWWALLLSALATVLVDPFSPQQLGWQLSFAAVVGLLVLVDPLAAAARRAGLPAWTGMAAAVPLGAGLATAPVLAAGVGDVSLTSLGANLIVEPVVAPVTWLGMVAAVLGPEGAPLSGWAVAATGPLLDWVGGVAAWAAAPGWAVIRPGPVVAAVPVALLLVVLAVATRPPWALRLGDRVRTALGRAPATRWLRVGRPRSRRARIAALAGLLLLVVAVGTRWGGGRGLGGSSPAALRGDGIVVLDVGQGSATLLRQGGATILVDAGPAGGRILDRLAEQGVERIDGLVLSHAAADHTGGAPAVVRRLRPAVLVDGTDGHDDAPARLAADAVRGAGGRVLAARRGIRVTSGPLTAEIRWPPPRSGPVPAGEDANDRAAVVRATIGGLRVLVPSDREGIPLRLAAGGPVDVLILPHHGSEDPDVPRLLQALRPRLAVAQVGARNGYGHPATPTVAALRAANVPLRRTDRDGSVAVTSHLAVATTRGEAR